MIDITLQLMAGVDIVIPECQLILHQPSLKEISYVGEKEFFIGVYCLCLQKKNIFQDKTILSGINNFQIFMMIMNEKQAMDKRNAVLSVFQLIFPSYKVSVLPRTIVFISEGKTIAIDENNFDLLQQYIIKVFCLSSQLNQSNFNPGDEKAKEIAEKLMRGRQRIAQEKGETEGSSLAQYISVLTVGLGSMSLDDCLKLTLFQLYDLIERHSLYINWDLDIRVKLAGGETNSTPDNWMKNIH